MRLSHTLLWGIALSASGILHAEDAVSMEELEQRLSRLEQGGSSASATDWTDKVSIKGFITYGLTRHDVHQNQANANGFNMAAGQPFNYQDRVTDEVSHRELSRAGIQFNAEINDKASAVVQLLARGRDNYDAEVQWAYIDYELVDGINWRGGRLMLPNSMHSQYVNVGYAYHWAALPSEVYGIVPFDTMDGMDLTWRFNTGTLTHELSAFYGSLDVPAETLGATVVYQGRDYSGINLRSRWGDLSTWLSYSHAKLSADLSALGLAAASIDDANIMGNSVGLQYDNGTFFLMAERTELDPHAWFPYRWGGYVSTGYRIGKWTPHVTWAATNSSDISGVLNDTNLFNDALAQANMVRAKSWTLGVRHELARGLDIKFEAQQFYDMSSEKFNRTDSNVNGMFSSSTMAGEIEQDNPTVYRIAVDAVF
ncbi:hypothetical protein [Alcanivorax sp. DP30]|uniref:hypothetical protein n=1 Tax=Alcanivorax sp. DP30 TaxID=2606217 RepID=UPI00137033EC|nr:hypothetical protein [Alcanivorax sp. DP30]MZR62342.1 hypothetical protein [Alcanivorax sp. DP30]